MVADSAPGDEYEECPLKAGPLIRAIGGRRGGGPGVPAAGDRAGGGVMARPSLRPRPAAGVFTSLLVTGGHTRGLADHVARLDASARQLFGKRLPATLTGDLAARLAHNPSGRLRITLQLAGRPLRALVEVVPLDPRPPEVSLRPAVIDGGLGGHKWLDWRLLAELARCLALQPGEQLLIEDADGEVLETDRADVLAVIGGVLHTPPADGRLLPGIIRDAVLRAARLQGLGVSVAPVSRQGCRPPARCSSATPSMPSGPSGRSPAARRPGRRARSSARWRHPSPPSRRETATAGHARRLRSASSPRRRRDRAGPVTVLIDNYDSFTYNLAHMLTACGCQVEAVRNDEVTAGQVAAFAPAGVVISPGPCTPADAGISMDVVRACDGQAPLLGICLGHQAIAAAFGASIMPRPAPCTAQTSVITHDGRGLLAGWIMLRQPERTVHLIAGLARRAAAQRAA